jgi:hypothetical protein
MFCLNLSSVYIPAYHTNLPGSAGIFFTGILVVVIFASEEDFELYGSTTVGRKGTDSGTIIATSHGILSMNSQSI